MSDESETKVSNKFQSSDMLKSIENLVDETLHIVEFNSEEGNAVREICETIELMLSQIKTSIKISPALLGPSNNVKRAILEQNGKIMITYRDDEVEYKNLTDFHPSMLMEILNDIFAKLKNATGDYRKIVEERVSVYRAANKKLKKIEDILKEDQKITEEDITESDMQPKVARLR